MEGRPSARCSRLTKHYIWPLRCLKPRTAGAPPSPRGVTPAVAPQTYFEYQVATPAELLPGTLAPVYPASLAGHNVAGEVDAMVVVDTRARRSGAVHIVRATNDLFAAAFRNALPSARFAPAKLAGKKVRQLVSLKYEFVDPR